jgi:ADP-ribose pyrophosphatase YjhB (NUDIX family)
MKAPELLHHAQRLQALAQNGITYAVNPYDLERYLEIREISAKLLQELTDEPFEKILRVFTQETGYQTPKIDIRAVVFRDGKEILLVREKLDHNRWTLPGGWADIGYSPTEVAVKEVHEEAGLLVKPSRLLALLDKAKHAHPPEPAYAYKAFIRCEVIGGDLTQETTETAGAAWFTQDAISGLELSVDRVTQEQLDMFFMFLANPELPALCD